ncbi:GNAT family N-acetyltransferase [Nitratifractor salsuginis]|uniref:GCN5-related N-acetyltransferase n=1 Tax=Nitratifractor salsuginis (strain DSM 16511 / JCM 12458 / E9I37-1) TaxID=749222 RepID=E6X2L6_NITSE|nr:GNAT family N-acetyltransferase [Nitratifractor salsuginis]ADV46082.1 GCN5-related N-acetyltransferase [Nitratifractor salsuginis DSM 16511]
MEHNITLTIPNDPRYTPLAEKMIEEAARLAEIEENDIADIVQAARELVDNAIHHAYPRGMQGPIDLDIQLKPHGIQISVHDMGLPFDFDRYMASEREGGLKRIESYVDELRFSNLGQKGKSFTIFKSHPLNFEGVDYRPYSDLADESPASLKPASIQVRDFREGDEEAISRLIYNNYTYSYYKSLFYYPKKIRERNEKGEIASIVAETREGKIVGHFALVKVTDANIAEIGVAVVDPDYKGMGIMNAMLDRVQQKAKEMKLDAIFGEALMMHPFSQRANLRHGFGESALLLGIVPNSVSLTDPNAVQTDKRAAVLVGYKILNGVQERAIRLPSHYEALIRRIYANVGLEIRQTISSPEVGENRIGYELSPYTQSGTIVIDNVGEAFHHGIHQNLHRLYKKHVDMIYADINLMQCHRIDEVIGLLREEGFVFSGVLFYRRGQEDYLRLQLPNSDQIETREIVCHSDFCHELHRIILEELNEEASGDSVA